MRNLIILVLILMGLSFLLAKPDERIPYEMQSYHKEKVFPDQQKPSLILHFDYPEFSPEFNGDLRAVNKSIFTFLNQSGYLYSDTNNFDSLWISFINDYEGLQEAFPDYSHSWEINKSINIKNITENIICLEYFRYEYTGGAHPNTYITYQNFDFKTGDLINLEDVISQEKLDSFIKISEEEFRNLWTIPDTQSLVEAGFDFLSGSFSLNDNFALLEDGILFYYNPYEIASYARGATKLFISYSLCQNILRSKYVFNP